MESSPFVSTAIGAANVSFGISSFGAASNDSKCHCLMQISHAVNLERDSSDALSLAAADANTSAISSTLSLRGLLSVKESLTSLMK